MLKFKGTAFFIVDEVREFNDKDKDGNKLATKTPHRITEISVSVMNGKVPVSLVVHGFDLPSNFVLPKENTEWETPELREVKRISPMVYDCRI